MDQSRQRCGKFPFGQRGSVLIIALILIPVIAIIAGSLLSLSSTEVSIAHNESEITQAFYMAESGIAEATRMLRDSGDWDIELAAVQPFNCPAGLVPAADGGCTFTIENDAADAGGATDDTNDIVVVKSTGMYLDADKEIEVAIDRLDFPLPPGAITSVGLASNVTFNGNAFSIDGNNWIPPTGGNPEVMDNTACTSGPVPRFGIAVPDATHQQDVKDDLTAQQQDNVTGSAPNPPWSPPDPIPSIGVDTTMTQSQLQYLVGRLMPMADYAYAPGTHLSSETLGTQSDPKIVVVDASGYGGSDPALTLSATQGAGILIVKDGTLKLTGASEWIGVVLVIGSNVAIEIDGGGDKSIYGSAILAEDTNIDATVAAGGGNLKIYMSCQGVEVANNAGGGTLRGATAYWKEIF